MFSITHGIRKYNKGPSLLVLWSCIHGCNIVDSLKYLLVLLKFHLIGIPMALGDRFEESLIWSVADEYADSNTVSDEEVEALSFCDLPITQGVEEAACEWGNTGLRERRDSNAGRSDQEDFEFGPNSSPSRAHVCPADDLFYNGRLLPLTVQQRSGNESDDIAGQFSYRKSNSYTEKQALLMEKLKAWRLHDSVEHSQLDYWNSSSKSQAPRSNFSINYSQIHNSDKLPPRQHAKPVSASTKSKQKKAVNSTARPPPPPPAPSSSKSSLKWQFFTLGLIKTPPMKLEDMRQRQAGRPSNYSAADNSILRRSASCNFYNEEIPKPAEREPRLADFKKKSKSVKENVNLWTEAETPRSKGVGWRMLKPLVALNGGCRASTNSVIQCSTKKFSHDSLAEPTKTSNRSLNVSLYADQNSLNSPRCSSKLAAPAKIGGDRVIA